jgi:hypothetical protein
MHVVAPHSGWAPGADDASVTACAAAAAADAPVLILGNADAERRAHLLGIRSWDRVCPALHTTTLRSPGIDHGPAAIVRARWPRRLVAWGEIASQLVRRLSARLDLPATEVSLVPHADFPGFPAVVPPALGPREALREDLNLAPTDLAIALADDPPGSGNATRLAFIAGLLALAEGSQRSVPMVPRGAGLDDRARRFHAGVRPEAPMLLLDTPTAAIWPAIDLAIITADPPLPASTLSHVSMLLASGVPVVGPRDAGLALLLGEQAEGLLCARTSAPQSIASLLHRSGIGPLREATAALAPRLAQFRAAFFDALPRPAPAAVIA